MPVNINGASSSANLQQVQNVNIDLPTKEEVKKTGEKPVAEEVQTPDAAKVKEEAESLVQKKDGLGVESAKKFAEGNKVELPGGGGATPFEKAHPKLALAAQIVEMIIAAMEAAMSQIADKLPNGIGKYITGGLGVLKGVCGLHRCKDLESASKALSEQIGASAKEIAEGIWGAEEEKKKEPCKAAKIIDSVGKMCKGLGDAKSWEDAVNVVGTAAADIALSTIETKDGDTAEKKAADTRKKETYTALKNNVSNFSHSIFGGIQNIKTALKESSGSTNEKMVKSLELFQKAIAADNGLSADEKNLVKTLSEGAIASIKSKGAKETLEIYESTLGEVSSCVLKGKNREVAEKTIALMKEISGAENMYKATEIVLDGAKALAGGKSEEVDTVVEVVKEAAKEGFEIVEKADVTAGEGSVQTDVGSFQDRLKNLEGLMTKGQS